MAAASSDRNLVTRWGSFGFFGPLTVLPEYWNRGVAKQLLASTMTIFDGWGLRHTGLFTFAQSAKHVGLYQSFGYWPRYLTAVMTSLPSEGQRTPAPMLLSTLRKSSVSRPSRHAQSSRTGSTKASISRARSAWCSRSAPATLC